MPQRNERDLQLAGSVLERFFDISHPPALS